MSRPDDTRRPDWDDTRLADAVAALERAERWVAIAELAEGDPGIPGDGLAHAPAIATARADLLAALRAAETRADEAEREAAGLKDDRDSLGGAVSVLTDEVVELREALQAAEDRLVAIYDIAGDGAAHEVLIRGGRKPA